MSNDLYYMGRTKGCGCDMYLQQRNKEAPKKSGELNETPALVNVHVHIPHLAPIAPIEALLQGI
jgi:hypothetical protein